MFKGGQSLLSFSPMPKLPRVYPSASWLPVFEKSTPELPFLGGFLAAAAMPAGDSLLRPAVLVSAGPKEMHAGARQNSSNSRRLPVVISPEPPSRRSKL